MHMNVGYKEVMQLAQQRGVDFKTAAKELGLTPEQAEALLKLGGDPGAPADTFEKKSFKESWRESQDMQDLWGGNTWEEAGLGEKAVKIIATIVAYPFLALFGCSKSEDPEVIPLPPEEEPKPPIINVILNLNTTVEIKAGMSVEDFITALNEIFKQYGFDKIGDIAATLKQLGLDVSEIVGLLDELKKQQEQNQEEIKQTHAIIIAMLESLVTEMKNNGAKLSDIITALKNNNLKLDDIIGVLLKQNFSLDAILEELKNQGVKLDEQSGLLGQINDKLDELSKEGKEALKEILIAISTNTDVAKGTEELVKELLAKLNLIGKDTNSILEIVAKIAANKPYDLSELKDLLTKILNATNKNGEVLNSIDSKLNFLGVALEGLKDQIGEGNEAILAKLQEILDKIPDGCNCKELDLSIVIQKLNDIIAKIQNQNNGNHEGILGDLDSLDGLL